MGTYFKLTKQKIGFYKVIKRIGENRIDPPQHMDIDPTFNMIDLYPCHEQSEGDNPNSKLSSSKEEGMMQKVMRNN